MQQNICIKYLQTYNIPGATGFKYHERPSTAVKNVSLLGLHPNLAEGACTGWPQTWKTWIRDLSEHGKLVEFSGNSVQPQGKLTLCSGCSLCQAIRMHPHKGGEASSPFSAHFYSGQTAGCIKMPLGMEVVLSPGDFGLDGDPSCPSKREAEAEAGGRAPPNFQPMAIVAGWLDGSRWHMAWR